MIERENTDISECNNYINHIHDKTTIKLHGKNVINIQKRKRIEKFDVNICDNAHLVVVL